MLNPVIRRSEGKSLGTMDMLIAAHSIAVSAVLVTSDKAFRHLIHRITLEDWTQQPTQSGINRR